MTVEETLKSTDRYVAPEYIGLTDQEILNKVKHLLDVKFEAVEIRSSSASGNSASNCDDCHTACCLGIPDSCGDGDPGAISCGP